MAVFIIVIQNCPEDVTIDIIECKAFDDNGVSEFKKDAVSED